MDRYTKEEDAIIIEEVKKCPNNLQIVRYAIPSYLRLLVVTYDVETISQPFVLVKGSCHFEFT